MLFKKQTKKTNKNQILIFGIFTQTLQCHYTAAKSLSYFSRKWLESMIHILYIIKSDIFAVKASALAENTDKKKNTCR